MWTLGFFSSFFFSLFVRKWSIRRIRSWCSLVSFFFCFFFAHISNFSTVHRLHTSWAASCSGWYWYPILRVLGHHSLAKVKYVPSRVPRISTLILGLFHIYVGVRPDLHVVTVPVIWLVTVTALEEPAVPYCSSQLSLRTFSQCCPRYLIPLPALHMVWMLLLVGDNVGASGGIFVQLIDWWTDDRITDHGMYITYTTYVTARHLVTGDHCITNHGSTYILISRYMVYRGRHTDIYNTRIFTRLYTLLNTYIITFPLSSIPHQPAH